MPAPLAKVVAFAGTIAISNRLIACTDAMSRPV